MNPALVVSNNPEPLGMCTFTTYDLTTGLIQAVHTCPYEQVPYNVPAGHGYVEGRHNSKNRKVDVETKQVIPHKPDAPDADHVWDDETEDWVLPEEAKQAIAADASARRDIERTESETLRALREWALSIGGGDEQALARLAQADSTIASNRLKLRP
jgi:hypothetical protein